MSLYHYNLNAHRAIGGSKRKPHRNTPIATTEPKKAKKKKK